MEHLLTGRAVQNANNERVLLDMRTKKYTVVSLNYFLQLLEHLDFQYMSKCGAVQENRRNRPPIGQ